MSVRVRASRNGRNRPYARRTPLVFSVVEWNDLQDALAVLNNEAKRRGRDEPADDFESVARLEDAKAIIHANLLNDAVVVTAHGPNGKVVRPRPSATSYFRMEMD